MFCFVFIFSEIRHILYMSTPATGFKRNSLQSYKDLPILFVKVRRKFQFCHNIHQRCVGQKHLTCDLKIFFRKSYVLKPSTAETQVNIFTVGVDYHKTNFIKILSWVLPMLILFTKVCKMVIFCCFFAISRAV